MQQAVLPFYDETTVQAAQAGLKQLPIGVDWEQVNEAVLRLAQREAARFAEQATSTSRTQTSQVIADWVKTGGTMPELIDRVARVWEGPRPDVAATTETTRIFAQGNAAAWEASNVVEGATIKTANDERVCPICGALADTDVPLDGELPPFHGGCRCWIVPRVKKPGEL